MKIKYYSLLLLILAVILSSCNDKPSDLAINMLPDTVQIKGISTLDTLLIPSIRVYKARFPLFNYGSVFIGKANGITAVTLSNFAFIPDSLSWLKEDKIESAVLKILPERYTFGDSTTGNFEFDIRPVLRRWNTDTTNYDSLIISPANYFGEVIATHNGRITLKDTLDPITYQLPKSLIIDWLRTEMKYDSTQGKEVPKLIPNWGIAYIPKENTNVIHRFTGNRVNQTVTSTIKVTYRDSANALKSFELSSGVDMTFLDYPKVDTNDIVIQDGVNYWTEIFFDLTMIPKLAGIHKARLELFLDKSKSQQGNVPLDSIIEANFFRDNASTSVFQYLAGSDESGKYTFNSITSSAQVWNKETGKGSIVVMPHGTLNQARELEKLVFYGLNAEDPAKRPTLKIIYSLNPGNFEPK